METVVVVLVSIAAAQGVYNLIRDAHHDFPLVDPRDEGTAAFTASMWSETPGSALQPMEGNR